MRAQGDSLTRAETEHFRAGVAAALKAGSPESPMHVFPAADCAEAEFTAGAPVFSVISSATVNASFAPCAAWPLHTACALSHTFLLSRQAGLLPPLPGSWGPLTCCQQYVLAAAQPGTRGDLRKHGCACRMREADAVSMFWRRGGSMHAPFFVLHYSCSAFKQCFSCEDVVEHVEVLRRGSPGMRHNLHTRCRFQQNGWPGRCAHVRRHKTI